MGHKYVKEDETFNTSQNGVVPKPTAQDVTNNKFLRADGAWASGAGGSVVSADQVVSSGTEIGGVTVDGVRTAFYAPTPKSDYSTTEKVVGTWIDGKPVYEAVFDFGEDKTFSQQSWQNTTVLVGDKKAIIDIKGINSGGTFWGMLGANVNNSSYVQLWQTRNSNITIRYLILRYTKTTD